MIRPPLAGFDVTGDKTNDSLAIAIRFFEWCRFNLSHYAEKLEPGDRKEYKLGKTSPKCFQMVKRAWSKHLRSSLPWPETFSVWKSALPDPRDLDKAMNCSMHLLPKLPKRIRNALARAERARAREIHDGFFSKGGDARLVQYLKVWQSQQMALSCLDLLAGVTRRALISYSLWNSNQKQTEGARIGFDTTHPGIERFSRDANCGTA